MSHNRFARTADHPDVTYIKQDAIGPVVGKALAELYLAKPKNQLEFLGNWLLNYAALVENNRVEHQLAEERETHRERYLQVLKLQEETTATAQLEAEAVVAKEESFRGELVASADLQDFLQALAVHLHQGTGATGAYIGIHERVKREVSELDDENAHEDEAAPMVIRYLAASAGSEFMLEQVLTEEEGQATYSVLAEEPPAEGESEAASSEAEDVSQANNF